MRQTGPLVSKAISSAVCGCRRTVSRLTAPAWRPPPACWPPCGRPCPWQQSACPGRTCRQGRDGLQQAGVAGAVLSLHVTVGLSSLHRQHDPGEVSGGVQEWCILLASLQLCVEVVPAPSNSIEGRTGLLTTLHGGGQLVQAGTHRPGREHSAPPQSEQTTGCVVSTLWESR